MLNKHQVMTIRIAVARADDKNAEIRKFVTGMHVPEAEIRTALNETIPLPSGSPPAESETKAQKPRADRLTWTDDMVHQLKELHSQGMGPTAIAGKMGLKVPQIQFKLSRLKNHAEDKPSSTPVFPAEKPHPEDLPEELAESIEYKTRHPEWTPPTTPGQPAPESTGGNDYDNGFDLTEETLCLIRSLEKRYQAVRVLRIQINRAGGWAVCSFEAEGSQYSVSLRRRRSR